MPESGQPWFVDMRSQGLTKEGFPTDYELVIHNDDLAIYEAVSIAFYEKGHVYPVLIPAFQEIEDGGEWINPEGGVRILQTGDYSVFNSVFNEAVAVKNRYRKYNQTEEYTSCVVSKVIAKLVKEAVSPRTLGN